MNPGQQENSTDAAKEKRPWGESLRRNTFVHAWFWEIAGALLSVVSGVGMFAILFLVRSQAISSWTFFLSPNTLISIFTITSKTTALFILSACIGQWKWVHFANGYTKLVRVKSFDEASRGPWGALCLTYELKGKALLASFGAFVVFISLAMEPFTQQVLSVGTRQASRSGIDWASTPVTQVFDIRSTTKDSPGTLLSIRKSFGAVFPNALYQLEPASIYDCKTRDCLWPAFTTLGVCASCQNVTFTRNCSQQADRSGSSRVSIECDLTTSTGNTAEILRSFFKGNGSMVPESRNIAQNQMATRNLILEPMDSPTILSFSLLGPAVLTSSNGTAFTKAFTVPEPMFVTDCNLDLCAKAFPSSRMADGSFGNTTALTFPFQPGDYFRQLMKSFHLSNSPFLLQLPKEPQFPGNKTFVTTSNSFQTLQKYLNNNFASVRDSMGFQEIVESSSDIAGIAEAISRGLTDVIRTGANSTLIAGEAFVEETFWLVQWVWLILPLFIVVSANLLLFICMYMSLSDNVPIWKSDSLALMFHGVHGWREDVDLLPLHTGAMEKAAGRVRVKLEERDGRGVKLFVE